MTRFVFLLLSCANLALTQTRDPAALLRQAVTLEAAKKWDSAADAYSAPDAIPNEPATVAPQAKPAARHKRQRFQRLPPTWRASPATIPAGQEFQSAGQCVPQERPSGLLPDPDCPTAAPA